MPTNNIAIQICNTIEEAPNYNTGANGGEGFKGAQIVKAIIVRKGMVSGNDTVDLQFEDLEGNKYSCMITARLLKSVTDLCVVG